MSNGLQLKKKGLILYLFIVVCILLQYHLFYLVPYKGIIAKVLWIYSRSLLLGLITICYWVAYRSGKVGNNWLNRYFIILIIGVGIEFLYSAIVFPLQEYFDTIRVACCFFMPASAIIFYEYFKKERTPQKLIKTINYINLIWCILLIIQSVLYTRGIVFMDFSSLFIGEDVYMRYGSLRVYPAVFADCMIIYNFSELYKQRKDNKKWWFHLVVFLVCVYCMFVVNQTRSEQVYVMFSLGLIILIGGKSIRSKVISVAAVIAFIYILTNTELIERILSLVGNDMRSSNTVSHRLYAIKYYLECVKNNPFFGNGFAMTSNVAYPYYHVEHGPMGWAYYSDIGMLGLAANVGMISLVVFFFPMAHIGRLLYKLMKLEGIKKLSFEIAYYIYLWTSAMTMITTDAERMIQFAFAIAYFEFLYHFERRRALRKAVVSLNWGK